MSWGNVGGKGVGDLGGFEWGRIRMGVSWKGGVFWGGGWMNWIMKNKSWIFFGHWMGERMRMGGEDEDG